jgi:hypothetical protein
MKYIEAPKRAKGRSGVPSLFLGGGISSCKLWQDKLIQELKDYNVTIYNPRRKDFDINNQKISEEQIKWEYKYLHETNILVFYFAEETLCPITLFELGAALERNLHGVNKQSIFIYCEPEYKRKFDVELQTKLVMKNIKNNGGIDNHHVVSLHDDYDNFIKNLKSHIGE